MEITKELLEELGKIEGEKIKNVFFGFNKIKSHGVMHILLNDMTCIRLTYSNSEIEGIPVEEEY